MCLLNGVSGYNKVKKANKKQRAYRLLRYARSAVYICALKKKVVGYRLPVDRQRTTDNWQLRFYVKIH